MIITMIDEQSREAGTANTWEEAYRAYAERDGGRVVVGGPDSLGLLTLLQADTEGGALLPLSEVSEIHSSKEAMFRAAAYLDSNKWEFVTRFDFAPLSFAVGAGETLPDGYLPALVSAASESFTAAGVEPALAALAVAGVPMNHQEERARAWLDAQAVAVDLVFAGCVERPTLEMVWLDGEGVAQ